MSKVEFTGKVGAKKMNFMIDSDTKLHTAYYVFLKTTDGGELTVTDEESPVGLLEAETRSKALTKGKNALKRLEGLDRYVN